MKVLLDACVPRPLRKFLPDHTVQTAQEMGWGQLKHSESGSAPAWGWRIILSCEQLWFAVNAIREL